jgi:hypothetical protein
MTSSFRVATQDHPRTYVTQHSPVVKAFEQDSLEAAANSVHRNSVKLSLSSLARGIKTLSLQTFSEFGECGSKLSRFIPDDSGMNFLDIGFKYTPSSHAQEDAPRVSVPKLAKQKTRTLPAAPSAIDSSEVFIFDSSPLSDMPMHKADAQEEAPKARYRDAFDKESLQSEFDVSDPDIAEYRTAVERTFVGLAKPKNFGRTVRLSTSLKV